MGDDNPSSSGDLTWDNGQSAEIPVCLLLISRESGIRLITPLDINRLRPHLIEVLEEILSMWITSRYLGIHLDEKYLGDNCIESRKFIRVACSICFFRTGEVQ